MDPIFDADNHYWESSDAFTRFRDPAFAERGVQVKEVDGVLRYVLDGEVFSCYSMTEPHGGSDPTQFKCRAEPDGDEWVINGDKFFSSNLRTASFLIVMCVTNPDVHPYQGMSMMLVPSDTPGIRVLQDIGLRGERFGHGGHAHVRYDVTVDTSLADPAKCAATVAAAFANR